MWCRTISNNNDDNDDYDDDSERVFFFSQITVKTTWLGITKTVIPFAFVNILGQDGRILAKFYFACSFMD